MPRAPKPELYKIVRHFEQDRCKRKVVARNLTRAEALAWTNDRNTSSKTAWKTAEIKTTRRCGPWFDGFVRQGGGSAGLRGAHVQDIPWEQLLSMAHASKWSPARDAAQAEVERRRSRRAAR
jgi:hypothetical protein